MPFEDAARYKSASQKARVVSEAWGAQNLYCPSCPCPQLQPFPPNTEAIDFYCPKCDSPFQLKSQSRPFSQRLTDAAYDAMHRAIVEGRTPNLLALHYEPTRWEVRDLILVPRFAFSLSLLEKRKPLRPTAERRGWVGCNILLVNIPPDAKIPMVVGGVPASHAAVREKYDRLRPLERMSHEMRGWTLDVLGVIRSFGKAEFSLPEVYAYTAQLQRLHPKNRHVEEKIRQQLQRLRDLGFLEFLRSGEYCLKP
jgi:type II restriction enzyme